MTFSFNGQTPTAPQARWVPEPLVQVGDLTSERNAAAVQRETSQAREAALEREIHTLKLERENAAMRARIAASDSTSYGSLKGSRIPDMLGDGRTHRYEATSNLVATAG